MSSGEKQKDEGFKIALIPVTDENRPALLRLALSMYLGEGCKYCDRVYETLEDLNDTVWAGAHEKGRLACRKCFAENNPDVEEQQKEDS